MRHIPLSLVAVFVLGCALGPAAQGQSGSCITWWSNAGGSQPAGSFNCMTEGPFLILCELMRSVCPPAAAGSETRCASCQAAGHPIDLATGNTYIQETDVKIPGLSGGLSLVRTWNSMWPASQSGLQSGIFGPNWRCNFEEQVFVGSDHYIKYARGDGSFWSFGYNGPAWSPAAPANVSATLVSGPSYWTLTFPNGEQRLFDNASGRLTTIIDRNGNTTQLSYDSSHRLITVTDPVSRHLYFTYGNLTEVTAVTSDFGISLSYAYDSQGRMNQVTNPDLSTVSFQYDANSLISAVTDSNGKILESHTYDSAGRGLTSVRAGGVDSITLTYGSH
jgi:YD repeat-containing protein